MSPKARIAWFTVLVVLVGGFALTYLRPRSDIMTGETMGTQWHVGLGRPVSRGRLAELKKVVESTVDDIDQKMSTYKETSEVSRFNAHQSTEPFPVSSETATVVEIAGEVAELCDGALDITVGPIVKAWGFGAGAAPPPGPPENLVDLLEHTGYELVESREGPLLVKADPRVQIDLSAVAKGYAVDRVAEALDAEGIAHYLVEIGGEVRVKGTNRRGESWKIGIERPDPKVRGSVATQVPITSGAVATSGSYRNFYEREGERVSHTIDPRSGEPINHNLVSVTVYHETSAAYADAWATALNVLGPEIGLSMATEQELGVLFMVVEDGQIRRFVSPTLEMDVDYE